ncbi:zinc finger protein with KRAB and SCAN domains 7-like [Myxocyprinus asiaticus]|uniref:zinc finger protein with KRAB and SCAN domains 7-like n=1 Tax=Myxocyprinus asiaticus TaxID=70543 RepID=UPI002223C586|nr:zinc finger protein with KRAB and SCAN domains 7-like [Myxocyprinus asiaticus]
MDGCRPVESSQLAQILQALISLHQSHQQTLLELRQDQDHRFVELLHAQAEDRQAIQSLLSHEVSSAATPDTPTPLPPPALQKMGAADDPEAFLDLFERTAEIWGWPLSQWAARLIPLLSGEAQLAAQQLPATSLLAYGDLKRAILQRVGRTPEESRQLFRSLKLESSDRTFAFVRRLRDACRRWLLAGDCDVDGIIDQVVLEQFTHRLPKGTAEWVQCHRPASLEEAVYIFSPPSVSSPSPLSSRSALSPGPVPAPRRRGGLQPLRPVPGCGRQHLPLLQCPAALPPQTAPDRARAYRIPTDASDRGLGAVLSQVVEGEERPVLYISHKLSLRETKYSTVEKECLAIKWAVLTLRYYLLGRAFTLCSDHAPLQWLHRMKDTNARITRWYLALQPFKFKVVHRPGAQMAVADFLSRNGVGVVSKLDATPA